jgi:putative transposase
MARSRNRHNPQLKAKVAVEALKGLRTTSELAAEHAVHPTQISQWKRQLLDGAAGLFESRTHPAREAPGCEAELYEQIGRLKMELEWLKKKAASLG